MLLNAGTNAHPYQVSRSTAPLRAANSNEPTNFKKKKPPGQHPSSLPLLIIHAWTMEKVGVGRSILNAGCTTSSDRLPDAIWGYVPAIPTIVVAVAELGRVPLASAFFYRGRVVRCFIPLAILALSYLAIENRTVGFERLFSMRLSEVMAAASAVAQADADRLILEGGNRQEASAQQRAELRAGVRARDESIRALTDQIEAAGEDHRHGNDHHPGGVRVPLPVTPGTVLCANNVSGKLVANFRSAKPGGEHDQ
jgi:hypothetical protein